MAGRTPFVHRYQRSLSRFVSNLSRHPFEDLFWGLVVGTIDIKGIQEGRD